jgi:tRNA A-37 threonylcarbamoyl transferase component Bud32
MERLPDTIGRYVVEALVGTGAMGRIYKAHDPQIRRTVAIKLISTRLMSSADRNFYIRRFRREAEAAARCVHPNVVTIYDFALHEGEPFLAMEFVHGISLRQALDERPVMAPGEAVGLILQVLDALACAHEHGVVHQDIKPANILLAANQQGGRQVKVSDFGVARIADAESTMLGAAGTPAYMAARVPLAARCLKALAVRRGCWAILLYSSRCRLRRTRRKASTRSHISCPGTKSASAAVHRPGMTSTVSNPTTSRHRTSDTRCTASSRATLSDHPLVSHSSIRLLTNVGSSERTTSAMNAIIGRIRWPGRRQQVDPAKSATYRRHA